MKYEDKLRDPRWQRKRLAIMSAADWKCQDCGDHKEELHVHHLLYAEEREPWEYTDANFLCICDTCHTIRHLNQAKVKAHAERLCVTHKTIYVFNRWWRFIKCPEIYREEAKVLVGQIFQEYRLFEKSVKERVGKLKTKIVIEQHEQNLAEEIGKTVG